MKRSIIAAQAIMIVGVAAAQSIGSDRATGEAVVPLIEQPLVTRSRCGEAVWPYLPAECGARPVRVVRAEALR